MILAARAEGCLERGAVIAAALSVQDPRDRPMERRAARRRARKPSSTTRSSDFLGFLKLWKFFEEALAHKKSNRKLAELCREQLPFATRACASGATSTRSCTQSVAELGWKLSDELESRAYAQIHRALLAGLLGNIGMQDRGRANTTSARAASSSGASRARAREEGRHVDHGRRARRDHAPVRALRRHASSPSGSRSVGAHLLKRHQVRAALGEEARAQVVAFERAHALRPAASTPTGACTTARSTRRVRARSSSAQALVEGEFETRAPFFAHNRKLVREIEQLEHKSRRPDVLVDDELIFAFYDSAACPRASHNGADFEHWRTRSRARRTRSCCICSART